jgi:hypothetical protein
MGMDDISDAKANGLLTAPSDRGAGVSGALPSFVKMVHLLQCQVFQLDNMLERWGLVLEGRTRNRRMKKQRR